MEKFVSITSSAIPLPIENIDTDQVIPARFLKATSREGFGKKLFYDWRFDKEGSKIAAFPLNDDRYSGSILLVGKNFGCGSSREHAAWSLYDHGFRVVVSSYFADIFTSNALNNGLLPLRVSEQFLKKLFRWVNAYPAAKIKVDLQEQSIELLDLQVKEIFEIPAFKKTCLLNGYEDIDLLLNVKKEIEDYEKRSMYLQFNSAWKKESRYFPVTE